MLSGAALAAPMRDAALVAASLHRGVNILGYDPIWSDPSKAHFKDRHFKEIHDAGFDFVRVVLQAFKHMDADNKLDPNWLETLDHVVKQARAAGLTVILDEHDFNLCSEAGAEACETKLLAFWRQVGARYADQPDTVLFELLNEPHGALDGEPFNAVVADVLPVIRASNPARSVIIGPTHWNNLADLDKLRLPGHDRHLIVTIHYYEPMAFTHQGAPWTQMTRTGIGWGTADERARLKADFERAAAWGRSHHRPMLLGEFGAYDGSGTPIELRAAWTAAVTREAEGHGIPWAYWQFDSDFIVYDMRRQQWVLPIKDALIPPRRH